jgi:hypothetical protein
MDKTGDTMNSEKKELPFLEHSAHDRHKEMLIDLQRETFDFFIKQTDPHTGLVADKTQPGSASSIAVVGMAVTCYIVGLERKFISRDEVIKRILKMLRFFYSSHQGTEKDATGYKGFYYHFLDMHTGKRGCNSELSTIDTTFLVAGFLSAAAYFTADNDEESEIRRLADLLYRRVDWQWALNGKDTITHGWTPEGGFIPYRWDSGYNEAHLMYVLALAAPEHPIPASGYRIWTDSFEIKKIYGIEYIYAGPLFIHQFSHMWIDFREIADDFNRKTGISYFENSKRATHVHRHYAIENPHGFSHYGENTWGITASDGPGNKEVLINEVPRVFYDYIARGAPFGPDDGTVAPWAVVASLPFAPDIVIDATHHAIERLNLKHHRIYGFDASFNPTYPVHDDNTNGWVSPYRYGLNQGPIIIMIENYLSGLVWTIMKKCPYIISGLQKAGFTGGWVSH